ncbi:hypothetical protein I5907_04450 [Panacibacter sp. DH6]|uniref:Lipoprotein n=1 Tax=Panacibacter microcysteis TaxID=2793269 RepID=A0A931E4Q5_9BACT|nr:hypothetical protein [Panacibacter microcysteis]MBG9375471.1 hypothetical protein [Panacibacter microcysteis]
MQKLAIAPACMVAAFMSILSLGSCSKSDNATPGATGEAAVTATAAADNQADAVYNDVADNVLGVNTEFGIGTGIGVFVPGANNVAPWQTGWEHCFTATISPETVGVFPKTVTLDFGEGCTGRDGHVRKGKMSTVYTGPLFVAGNTATTTFEGFYFDSLQVEGKHTLANNSTADGHSFTSVIENGKITAPSGTYTTWNRTRSWAQTEGMNTPYFPVDDVYNITGNSNGTIVSGTNAYQWTGTVTEPLVRKLICPWTVAGKIEINSQNLKSVLDFGNGTCDRKATLTINGKIFEINW